MSLPINCNKRTAATIPLLSESSQISDKLSSFTDSLEVLPERKLAEVRRLVRNVKGSTESLAVVDALQRLGIDHHFEPEILNLLQEQHLFVADSGRPANSNSYNLYEVALRFRLLRQEGYYVTADIFKGFMSEEGGEEGPYVFDPKLRDDIIGLMSFYEASHLSIKGEDILDEAANFCRSGLTSFMENDEFPYFSFNGANGMDSQTLRELVMETLSNPFHKSLPRFTSKRFQVYPGRCYEWGQALKELAILDSSLISSINRTEILQVSKWWNDLGLAKKLKFARDQPLKWYMWPMAMLLHPRFSQERLDLTKPIAMVYIIDDIFDVYGSLDELTLFTEAINRWECTEELPDYMKTCFYALDGITNEVSLNVYKKHGWNPANLFRRSWVHLCNAFLVEARWFASPQSPSSNEYLKNAMVSSGGDLVLLHLFAFLSEGADRQVLGTLNGFLETSSPIAKILRLWDDLGSAKDENQDGRDGSYVEYHMKENPSCSIDEAREHVMEMISDVWKSLNKECLFARPLYVNNSMAKASLNAARMVPLMYDYGGIQRRLLMEQLMKSLVAQ